MVRTVAVQLTELRDAYHKILKFEYSKYKRTKKMQQVFFTLRKIQEKIGLSQDVIKTIAIKTNSTAIMRSFEYFICSSLLIRFHRIFKFN